MADKKLTRAQKREHRLAKLKLAATEIFAKNGYHATKVSQIVGSVGVAQGTFYLYYEGKKPLFGELLSDFLALLVATISDWKPSGLDDLKVLEIELQEIGVQLAEVLLAEKHLTKIFFREALGVDPVFDKIVRGFYNSLYRILGSFIKKLWEHGLIEKMNFELLAIQTVGAAERVIEESVVNETINVEPAEMVEHLVVTFLSGTRQTIKTKH